MKRARGAWPTAFVAFAAVAAALVASADPASRTVVRAEEKRTCCVANPAYAGICQVALGEGETCQNVLDYLNNANSVGRTYCGGTNIRGGWKQVACQEHAAHATTRARQCANLFGLERL